MKKIKGFLGVDIGSISTKAVVIDKNRKIYASSYIWTEANPIQAVKRLLGNIEEQLKG
jgi:activator of 2-hydroxyglutaryl-CoA dehydratase